VEGILLAFGVLSWIVVYLLRDEEDRGEKRAHQLLDLDDLNVEVEPEQVNESKYV
jgi:hypothetical protein